MCLLQRLRLRLRGRAELAQGIDGGAFAAPERHTPGEPGVWGVAGFRQPRMARGWGGARNLVHET